MSLELNNVSSGYSTGIINDNFQSLEEYINSKLLNRDGTEVGEANQMQLTLDMNSHDVINVGELRADSLTLSGDNQSFLEQIMQAVEDSEDWSLVSKAWATTAEDTPVENGLFSSFHYSQKSEEYATDSSNSAASAEASKEGAQNAEAQAQAYSELGLATGDAFDLGFVSDDIIYFPTDWGNVA